MKTNCNDCGRKLTDENITHRNRQDVCDECLKLRGDMVAAFKDGRVTLAEFQRVQKAMRGRSHAAYSLMRSLLKNPI